MKLHKILTQQICTRNLRKLLYEILDSVSPSLVIFSRWRRRQFCRKEALSSVDRRERRKERKQLTFCCRCSTIAFLIHSRPHSGSLKPRFGRCSIVILRAYRASLVMSWSTYTHNNNNNNKLLISAPSLGVYYFFVVDSVCHKHWFFLFVYRWNRAIFGRQFSMTKTTKRCSSIFDLGLQRPKFTPQNLHKIAYKSACMADRPAMFGPTRGFFGDGRFNGTMQNVVGRPLLPWHRNLG